MMGLVERGTDEIVHSGVNNQETLAIVLFSVDDRSQQDACWSDNAASGLKQQAHAKFPQRSCQNTRVRFGLRVEIRRGRSVVGNPESAPGVNEVDAVPVRSQFADQGCDTIHSFSEWRRIVNLGS